MVCKWTYLSLVPQTGKDQEAGLTDSFEYAEKRSNSDDTGEVLAGRVKSKCHSPEDNVNPEIFGDGYALDDPIGRIFDNQYSDVDACCQPRVLSYVVSISIVGAHHTSVYIPADPPDASPF